MKLEYFLEELDKLNETGIKGIRKIAKKSKKSIGYGHKDTDGITSSIGFKSYLEQYGIKTVDWHPIQYGPEEFSIPEPKKGYINWIVDFSHTKGNKVDVWLDHHEGEHKGAGEKTSTKFAKARSNIGDIQDNIAFRDIFPPEDLEIISTVDSADFYKHGLSPDDIMRAAFGLNKELSVKENHWRMGLVVNKLLLTYKNKSDFLKKLVLNANPSLISMYNIIRRLAKKEGYNPPEEVEKQQKAYNVQQQKAKKQSKSKELGQQKTPMGEPSQGLKQKAKEADISEIKNLKSGESIMVDNTVVQYGGGKMGKGVQYDRYTVFKNNPDANFLVIGWPLGLVQASANPFKPKNENINLIDIVLESVMQEYKSEWDNKMISLGKLKKVFEENVTKKNLDDAIGFTFDDLINQFSRDQIQGIDIDKTGTWNKIVKDITNKKWKDLTNKQKNVLSKVKISLWDVVMSSSGGHPGIVNLSNLQFLGKGYTDTLKEIMTKISKRLNQE